MEKRTPNCPLSCVKALIQEGKVRPTQSARLGAKALGFDLQGMISVVTS